MLGKYKSGFSLIEIMIVIAIVAILVTIATPLLQQRMTSNHRQTLLQQLNRLASLAWQQALSTHKLHSLLFDFDKKTISIEQDSGTTEATGQPKFQKLSGTFTNTTYQWHDSIEIRQFSIEGVNEMTGGGKKVLSIAVYINPDGLAQEAVITAVEHKLHKEIPFSLTLNPFSAQFTYHDTTTKPSA